MIKKLILILALLPTFAFAQTNLSQGGTGWSTSTLGDLFVGTTSKIRYTRLPIGSTGNVLWVSGGQPAWVATSSLFSIASASLTGLLSSVDWSTFNNKVSNAYASSTFPSFTYASSTYYFASNPSNYISLSSLSSTYPIQYNSSTGVISTGFSTSTINSFSAKQTFTNASSTSFTGDTLYSTTGIFGTGTFSSTLNVTGKTTLGMASTTAVTATDFYGGTYRGAVVGTTGTFSSTLGVTGKTTLANASSTSITVSGVSYLATSTVTGSLTVSGNIPNRVVGYTASSTITINVDTTDEATTTVNQTTIFANPTGTPINGFMYLVTITATGTRTLSWGTSFASSTDLAAPLTTASGTMEVLWKYDQFLNKYLLLGLLKTF